MAKMGQNLNDLVERTPPKSPREMAKFQKNQQDIFNKGERITPNTKPPKLMPLKSSDKQNTDIFREGMTPPIDDDMGSAQPGQPGQPKKKFAKGGKVSSASGRADGIAQKGKTKCRIIGMAGGGMC